MLLSLMPCFIGKLRAMGLGSLVAVWGDVGSGRSSIKRSMIHHTVRQAWKGRRDQHLTPQSSFETFSVSPVRRPRRGGVRGAP